MRHCPTWRPSGGNASLACLGFGNLWAQKDPKVEEKELLAFCSGLLGLGFGVLGLGIGLKGLEARKRGCLYHNNKALDIELKP